MKRLTTACLAIVLAGLMTISPVWAHGGGGGHYGGGYYGGYRGGYYGGIGIYGLGLGYYGWPYYSPYYAYPPAVVQVPSSPPVYIEQGGGQVASPGPAKPIGLLVLLRRLASLLPLRQRVPGRLAASRAAASTTTVGGVGHERHKQVFAAVGRVRKPAHRPGLVGVARHRDGLRAVPNRRLRL